jgi:dynein heavy chain, axonemal
VYHSISDTGRAVQVVSTLHMHTDLNKVDGVLAEVKALDARLKKAEKEAQRFNSREAMFSLPITDYSQFRKILDSFDPFFQFWSVAASWKVTSACIVCI